VGENRPALIPLIGVLPNPVECPPGVWHHMVILPKPVTNHPILMHATSVDVECDLFSVCVCVCVCLRMRVFLTLCYCALLVLCALCVCLLPGFDLVHCDEPGVPSYGYKVQDDGHYAGTVVLYACNPGYSLHGSGTLTCLSGDRRVWDMPLPSCLGACPAI